MIRKRSALTVVVVLSAVALMSLSCGRAVQRDKNGEKKPKPMSTAQLEELSKKRQARTKALEQMNVGGLARELRKESDRGVEPFNSMAYRELVSRKGAGSELKSLLKDGDRSSLLGLLALRRVDLRQYSSLKPSFRVSVLVDSLKSSKYFNTWGLPHRYWEDAAEALIAEGTEARKPLRSLLDDRRRAPLWGSEEVLASREYGYRVCDYAWAMLTVIDGEELKVPSDPKVRDKLISRMKSEQ
jgi:hypothetical protein